MQMGLIIGSILKVRFLIHICIWYIFVCNKPLSFFKDEQSIWRSIILRIEWCSVFGQFTRFSRRLSNDCKVWCLSCWANGESYSIEVNLYTSKDMSFSKIGLLETKQNYKSVNQLEFFINESKYQSEHFECHKLYKWKMPSI